MFLNNRTSAGAQARDGARPLLDVPDAGAIAAARATDRAMIAPFRGVTPVIDPAAYVMESAAVIGDVVIR
jgi:hypothetical protein